MFILVDCNNFYASCERVFNPKLRNKAVIVLSNNDGCVIARSKEAKNLNIPMGAPIFKYKDIIERKNISVFSSNFPLYGDMSMRVMKTLESFNYKMEIYSIDEAFLYICDKNIDFEKLSWKIKNRVYRWSGIPVSVGVAKTKTLCKLTNEIAKKSSGVFILDKKETIDTVLSKNECIDIWGIGSQLTKRLKKLGIHTAKDLKDFDDFLLKKHLSINGLKTALELREVKCFNLDENPSQSKSICTSRTFSIKIEGLNDLEKNVSSFVSTASIKLRKQKLLANFISVFISTSFHGRDPFYSNSCHVSLPTPTSFTPDLTAFAKKGLKKIFKKGFQYKKAGIILSDLCSQDALQQDFFSKLSSDNKNYLMKVIDTINFKSNKKAVFFAAENFSKNKFKKESNMLSKKFTTSFDELIRIKD